jgi:hypothetical protein
MAQNLAPPAADVEHPHTGRDLDHLKGLAQPA